MDMNDGRLCRGAAIGVVLLFATASSTAGAADALSPSTAASPVASPTAPLAAGTCPAGHQPSRRSVNDLQVPEVAVSQVADFQGLWKVITQTFGPPPKDVVADPTAITSLQVVWYIDTTTGGAKADVYAFDAQNCYVLNIGIDPTMLPLIEPYTTVPTFAAVPISRRRRRCRAFRDGGPAQRHSALAANPWRVARPCDWTAAGGVRAHHGELQRPPQSSCCEAAD